MPRRSTKGPLDVDVSAIPSFQPPTPALQTALPPSPAPTSMPVRTASPASSLLSPVVQQNPAAVRTRSKSPAARTMQLDLSLLLRPSLYAPVPTTHLASPFLDSSTQPAPDTDLETLLSNRRFLHAADKATDILTSGSITPSSTQRIFELLYTRFSCLVLCNQSSLAAKEAKPLSELLARESSSYTRPHREIFLMQVPWSLRLLLLKLSVLGTADLHRRAIMGLYGLSSECRVLAQKARVEKDDTAFKLWKYRLGDLGLRVAGELIEMGELETAKRHLDTLSFAAAGSTDNADDDTNGKMCMRKTLLLLKIGDTQAAKKCLSSYSPPTPSSTLQSQILETLLHFSTSSYSLALSSLLSLTEQYPSNPLLKHNLAIAYLYTNNVTLASEILEALVTEDEVLFPALLVNLSTVYELRTERARERKLELVDRVAEMGGRSGGNQEMQVGGFEREMGEFKLAS
ncbi:hypothetical protein E4T50_10105 [Aureobasidium sp. EXF-12298]|nr:hypothetical protein E4T50_10105 [Aureobasidium sp. EXF-12298]KAI4757830.1 hypothetical protein E4T51_09133 [Aureobasidium sp. EXF-12344]KAI4778200.1 hypothetical protein E4T52_06886 [Aureobasidium sp. EXF-3400]